MRPILFELPGLDIKVHSYGVMIFLACFAALGISVWRARREQIDPNIVYGIATWLFLGGVIGARGMYVVLHPGMIHGAGDIFRSWQGGNVFYGCILGGLTGSLLFWCRHPFPFWPMADAAAPAVAIGAAVGRLGCFLNGCCDGVACSFALGCPVPGRLARVDAAGERGVDRTRCAILVAGAPHAALRGPGWPVCALRADGLFPQAPPAWPGDRSPHDPVLAHAVADRVATG
jgi:prolipoprotein diacylglyceryltransferase